MCLKINIFHVLLFQLPVPQGRVVRGPGGAPGASHHGAGAGDGRAGGEPPGRPQVPPGLLPRQSSR